MKKFFFFAAALLTAMSLSAEAYNVDLSTFTIAGGSTDHLSTPVVTDGVLSATLTSTGDWENAGVEFALPNLTEVTSIAFEFQGSASNTVWSSFQVYLTDENDVRWFNAGADLAISGSDAWQSKEYMPTNEMWTSGHTQGTTFKAIGFLANPMSATAAPFAIRNVVVNCGSVEPFEGNEYVVDLSTAANANGTNCSWVLNADELNVTYDFSAAAAGSWPNGGVVFALPNLTDVVAISYEFIGNSNAQWTSFHVFLTDENGIRWINSAADLHINGVTTWTAKEYMPADELWTSGHTRGTTFTAIGFLANCGDPTQDTFGLRNVKVLLENAATALDQVEAPAAVKRIENGQLVIIRDGVRYNALGK